MAKKNNTKKTTVETTAIVETPVITFTGADLQHKLEIFENVSLRKLAIACELSYGWILKCAKEPIPNVPYDPEAINYEKVAGVFVKRGIDLNTIDWGALNVLTPRGSGAALTKNMDAFQVGAKVYLREDNKVPFEICYKTETHIVIMKEGTTEPRSWSHATFLMKGPVFEPRTITEKTTTRIELEAEEEAAITAEIQAEAKAKKQRGAEEA